MSRYRLSLVTAPASEPVTLAEAKTHMRVDSSADDTLISNLIIVARQGAEKYTNRAFINQTWKMFLDSWPMSKSDKWWDGERVGVVSELSCGTIEIPLAPLSSVTSIKTYNEEGTATTYDSSNYYVTNYSGEDAQFGRITFKIQTSLPIIGSGVRLSDGIEINFVAGYGASASSVPQQIKQAILAEVAMLYENRGDCTEDTAMRNSLSKKLLTQFRIFGF